MEPPPEHVQSLRPTGPQRPVRKRPERHAPDTRDDRDADVAVPALKPGAPDITGRTVKLPVIQALFTVREADTLALPKHPKCTCRNRAQAHVVRKSVVHSPQLDRL